MNSRQEGLLENLVRFKPHRQYKVTVTVLHGRTFHIMIQDGISDRHCFHVLLILDVKRDSKSSPKVLCLNNKLATYIRSSC